MFESSFVIDAFSLLSYSVVKLSNEFPYIQKNLIKCNFG